ncbi:LysM peptidoglycan-binding domain-containing protein [Stenotrophomonas sp. MMGLT7]|uniref:LysM peptidoglycan-binding domain-containing protein n=1 Tax=Stenotrophomonas sp. MMGLT7 TaxID=2901227 RepID=UPI001E41F442|nr:LysM peptidoglycan-binding domain-containing protein [Stenotrophomonas sp. MMGLT7]MCD7099406.1 LysM peptidoglycan-binding domain-containing protein [Stenotrophomonas sp. MMGLT7]
MREFLTAVAQRESNGDARIINKAGYVGKYQFGEAALIDLGYYLSDGSDYRNNWKGQWAGKNGIFSLEDFRSSPDVQDMAGDQWFKLLCKRAKKMGLDQYFGKTINGIYITESGILAGMHLVGTGTKKNPAGVAKFLFSEGKEDPVDGFGTAASEYIRLFGGYSLGCCSGTLNVALQDRAGSPISGVGYEIRNNGSVLQNGSTTVDGNIEKPIPEISFSGIVEFWIERVQGGLKQIWNGRLGSSEHNIVLKSPKIKIAGKTKSHAGSPGTHNNRTEQARKSGAHVVRRGDSLWAIAKRHGTTVKDLRELNPSLAHTDLIKPGQTLVVRSFSGTNTLPKTTGPQQQGGNSAADASAATSSSEQPAQSTIGTSAQSSPNKVESNSGNSDLAPSASTKSDRTRNGHPVTIASPVSPEQVQEGDKVKRMLEILAMNVKWGDPQKKPNGPAAVTKARSNTPISSVPKAENKSLGRCYLYVKVALQASGMTGRYLQGAPAKEAGAELEAEGFRNLLDMPDHEINSPYDAPVGSVIVYDVTDGSRWGHIEIRMDDGSFASDYRSPNSRVMRKSEPTTMIGRKRKVIGIWVKS